ncbi:hypothetical protein [Sediminibacillus halophilus]|uniref:Uncharacterized protein n=1 Tax=Sediminibacillus halophilus TaxID=482461 RepID=A0A1G9NNG4_9BACI|nr:hypothetical protein [Sediminibacillus halophilus]SDL87555.1 hypothetical protein SAMN05216244_1065 [Sediminibacillus halophilus]
MNRVFWVVSILVGVIAFLAALLVFLWIDSPSPYLGALVIGFLIFEISFYHRFQQSKEKRLQ